MATNAVSHAVHTMAVGIKKTVMNKQQEVVLFSSTAIALYGYDQGMMSLINTNFNYLHTMGIGAESPLVATIVSIYYIGCAVGAILASRLADWKGRKPGIVACLVTTVLGNLFMFVAGLGYHHVAVSFWIMMAGRFIMGLGVGGVDAVIPVYSAELHDAENRGTALAQEFQANILGLNLAFGLNLIVTRALGKTNQWAWRIPIIAMQVFPVLLLSFIYRLPESPRWLLSKSQESEAREALADIYDADDAKTEFSELQAATQDDSSKPIGYDQMLLFGGSQFHPTVLTIMGQVNQALTGYGCISVYGPQTFQLLGFGVFTAELITQGNYLSYFAMMTLAWILIDRVGRRRLMLAGSAVLIVSFLLLTLFGGLVMDAGAQIPVLAAGIPGVVVLYLATAAFGIGWLPQPWLIPTEIYPSAARAQGAAISVVIWGVANFAITFLSPIFFNNLKYWIFLIFAGTNAVAGLWTYLYSPETGGRTFEENVAFFEHADEQGTWRVQAVDGGAYTQMPSEQQSDKSRDTEGSGNRQDRSTNDDTATHGDEHHDEQTPLLGR